MNIKTWQEEAKEWPEHRRGLATNQMIWMQQEIDELRAAYEALQKENADLQKENDDQKRKIIELEKELVEWHEFKKIRDAQMQALRKQMP